MTQVLYLLFCALCRRMTKHNRRFTEDEEEILVCAKCGTVHPQVPLHVKGDLP